MVLVLAVIAGYGIYRVVDSTTAHSARTQASSGQVPRARSTHPAVAASTPPATPAAPVVNPNVVVRLTAIQDCWVEFTKPDGRFLAQAYVVGGSSKTWTFSRKVNMDIGNPGGIVLTVNGKKLGSPGATGQPVTLSLGPGRQVTGCRPGSRHRVG